MTKTELVEFAESCVGRQAVGVHTLESGYSPPPSISQRGFVERVLVGHINIYMWIGNVPFIFPDEILLEQEESIA